jgi:hypothetical protein
VSPRCPSLWRTAVVAALALTAGARGDGAPGDGAWKLDVVHRKKGPPLQGLVLGQTPAVVHLQYISRKPGSSTIVYKVDVPAAEVERVERLSDEERDRLRQRLDALRQERLSLLERLKGLDPGGNPAAGPADTLDLHPIAWVVDPKVQALEYRSTHFRLVSNARRDVVELAALHLEQIYAAYARCLPPRAAGSPTLVVLTSSLADYQDFLRGRGLTLGNPAFYDPDANQVVCASDLQRLAGELVKARQHHAALCVQLGKRKAELEEAYRGKVPPEMLAPIEEARKRIRETECRNADAFQRARDRLFQRLYHEAFHAYLANFVYPPGENEVPRWLNEGLAQVFETAILEAGELRVGHAPPERLAALRQALARDALVPLPDLLRAGPRPFQVAHAADRQASDRYYLASWALAHYLTFERQLLGTPALDEYVKALHRGREPVEAFCDLINQPLPAFEKSYLDFLQHLKPEGKAGPGG